MKMYDFNFSLKTNTELISKALYYKELHKTKTEFWVDKSL